MAALKSQNWLVTNQPDKLKYKPSGSKPIRINKDITLATGYIVIPAGAYSPELRKFLENTIFSESRRAKVGLGQKTG